MKIEQRKSLSKKIRFNVFKRDAFTCQYCGKTPPGTVLEVDHIHPVSKGGQNSIDNLITACFDCNRGKSAGLLTSVPLSVVEKSEILQEREDQMKAFNKLLKSKRKREDDQIDELEEVFNEVFPNHSFMTVFKNSIRQNFIPYITQDEMLNAMSKSCGKCHNVSDSIKYFCGICWNIRREK